MYDLIGDIHGHADELEALLNSLGYRKSHGIYGHPDRKVIFLGDFIDRGPQIRQVLEIVRPMIEEGRALSVMGNHELNALAYHTEYPKKSGEFLRPHNEKNQKQHSETLKQLSNADLESHLNWFRSLPFWLDLDGLRVVHACWDPRPMSRITHGLDQHGGMTDEFLFSACSKEQELFDPVEVVLKGKEISLPEGLSFQDKDMHERFSTRVRWYLPANGQTYRTYSWTDDIQCELPINASSVEGASPYPPNDKPVFIGHYWLSAERPEILVENVACVDYSVAKRGFLCAYRWDGEQKLSNEKFVWTK